MWNWSTQNKVTKPMDNVYHGLFQSGKLFQWLFKQGNYVILDTIYFTRNIVPSWLTLNIAYIIL
jgi:hypothetical protein